MSQLLESELSVGLDEQPYVMNLLQYAKEESTVRLYNRTMEHPERNVMSVQTGLSLVKKGKLIDGLLLAIASIFFSLNSGGFAYHTDGLSYVHPFQFHQMTSILIFSGSYGYNMLRGCLFSYFNFSVRNH